ncbi:putative pal1 cell morphology protein [Eutypa lata UCREL1]|uniref:Putative pal1 cell morphology protein n=1 Tax=Eutypa lata (strain UCR-EL1) TaxID=1287681 RepID=M7T643_EUTLA|nr:putative pal1 cell morphology protein [Eutypa lata UCREL1]
MASSRDTTSPSAEELFDNLIIDDGNGKKPLSRPNGDRPAANRPSGGPGSRRGENAPRGRGPPPSSHRPTRSQEEALRARKPESKPKELNIFESPPRKRSEARPRRNSDTSVLEIEKPMTEEEKKRRKDRDRRHRDQKSRPSRKLDVIDKLDATGIYGGGLFHHDGPFDACNPHRNRKGSRRAPMHAFAKDSANNSIGGAGPINARPDHAAIMGYHDDEAFKDYAAGAKDLKYPAPRSGKDPALFDPKGQESIHGDESLGLGTSTFLEGAPAPRTAIQRREAEMAQETMENGLQRKKSLAQRIRHINRGPSTSGRITSPDAARSPRSGDMPSANSRGERNPFFNEFDTTEEQITVKGKDSNPRSPGSPDEYAPALERRVTADAATSLDGGARPQGGGFMQRVKSLKGGRRQRPEQNHGPPPAASNQGTAL